MAKKQSESSARGKRVAKKEKPIKDSDLDFSDIPESTDEELARAKRVGYPKSPAPEQVVAIRIDPVLLAKLQRLAAAEGKPYQTFIHEVLEGAAKKSA